LTATLGLGAAAHDTAGVREAIRLLLGSADAYRRASENSWRYFQERHRPEIALPQVERIFLEAAAR
jgi:hypothetical protein